MNDAKMPRLKDKNLQQEAEAELVREKAEKKDIKLIQIIKKAARKDSKRG